jgi:hypothetical protein
MSAILTFQFLFLPTIYDNKKKAPYGRRGRVISRLTLIFQKFSGLNPPLLPELAPSSREVAEAS